ncbi:hypothetical protein [Arthrobacter oryzae]|uniref:Uncharacterized protein n=1 Tax=Arthrobacter oryzae TaxID=409290 RepID=A0A3N0BMU0_9MICC|nr:hypothetical protein [Arthrobacter oryzae]RNL49842.1 hypothetical protein D7003_17025 [Arthrobacter oryzae]
MPFSWSGRTTQTLSAAALSALLLASAGKHFDEPGLFVGTVPDVLCRDDSGVHSNGPFAVLSREEWVAVSGLLQAGAAVGLLIPATRRATAACVAALSGLRLACRLDVLRRADGPGGTSRQRSEHALRLALHVPLIAWAWSLRTPVLSVVSRPGPAELLR